MVFLMENERFVSICRRGYRDVFWGYFCQGKVYPGEGRR
nr:MAG TPA: hypothetical protein [Caudoviricetes sp.]